MTKLLIIHSSSHPNDLSRLLNKLDYQLHFAKSGDDITKIITEHNIALALYFLEKRRKGEVALKLPVSVPLMVADPAGAVIKNRVLFTDCATVDYLQPPHTAELVAEKIRHLLQIRKLRLDIARTREQTAALQEKVANLRKSIDGHNSFLDLISRRDGLTGLFNRRHFNGVCQELLDNALNLNDELSLALLNLDYFSEINKSCGQEFGDFVLNELSARITKVSRKKDLCFRLSGEEFAILMPSTSAKGAWQITERIRSACTEKPFEKLGSSKKVTISAGIASLREHEPATHEELISMANQALFLAKSEGRNRSVLYAPLDRDSYGSEEKNFTVLEDTINRILGKTKIAAIRSLQLLAQGIMDREENEKIRHTQECAELLSRRLGFTPPLIETCKNAITLLSSIRYLLHNEMICKKGQLNSEEWEVLADFPYKVTQLVELFDFFSGEKSILLYHGERFDGSGYPEGLQGEQIPIGARVFHLASSFAAMNSDRPYRRKLSGEEILTELADKAGSQFDPHLVAKLIDVIEETSILEVAEETINKARLQIEKSIT